MSTQPHRLTDNKLLSILALSQNATGIYTGEDIVIQFANDALIALWGKDRSVIGKPIAEALPELQGQPFIGLLQSVWRTGITYEAKDTPANLEVNGRLQTFYFDFVYQAIIDEAGRVECILHTTTDVTERYLKQQIAAQAHEQQEALDREQALNEELSTINEELQQQQAELIAANVQINREARERLLRNMILDASSDFIGLATLDGTGIYVNPAALAKWGWDGYEGRNAMDAIYPADREYARTLWPEIVSRPYSSYEIRFWNERTGEAYWVEWKNVVIKDPDTDEVIAVATVSPDITVRKKYEQELQMANAEMGAINEELTASNEELLQTRQQLEDFAQELENRVLERTRALAESESILQVLNKNLAAANASLTLSEARFKGLSNSPEIYIAAVNAGGKLTYVNPSFIKLTGRSEAELMERGYADLMHPDDGAEFFKNLPGALSSKTSYNSEFRLIGSSGNYRWLNATVPPLFDADGNITGYICAGVDVTARKDAERLLAQIAEEQQAFNEELQSLNEELTSSNEEQSTINEELLSTQEELLTLNERLAGSESRFRSLVDNSPFIIVVFRGADMVYETCNQTALQVTGKDTPVIGLPLLKAIPELEGEPIIDILKQVYQTGQTINEPVIPVTWIRNGKSQISYFNLTFTPLYDGNLVTGVLETGIDITEQVMASMRLKDAEEKLQLAIDVSEMGIWEADLSTGLLTLSDRTRHMHGLPATKVITLTESMGMIDPEYRELVNQAIGNAVAQHTSFQVEYLLHPVDGGAHKWLRATGKATYDAGGNALNITGTILNITEQKQDELRKNDFIAMVSHEMKTPLTSMTGYLQLLQLKARRANDNFTLSALDKTVAQAKKMATMINGFLNVSRLESGKINIDKQRFDMAVLVKEVEDEILSTISSHKFVFHPVEYTLVDADRDKIGQVINNFISNAVKYSPMGSTIQVACVQIEGNTQVCVQDEGMGIATEDQNKLFDRYYRVEGSETKSIAGFGIGLYLCAEIIQRHEGRIWVKSEPGKGSTFYFSLPLAQ